MISNFLVGIQIAMASNAAGVLAGISRGLFGVEMGARRANAALGNMAARAVIGGAALTLIGTGILSAAGSTLQYGERYLGIQNAMITAGRTQLEITQAQQAAIESTAQVISTTRLQGFQAMADIRPTVNSMEEAAALLPQLMRVQAVVTAAMRARGEEISAEEGNAMAFDLARATQIFRPNDVGDRQALTEGWFQAMQAQGWFIRPAQLENAARYIKTDRLDMSDEYLIDIFPSILSDMMGRGVGASRAGTAMEATRRLLLNGRGDLRALRALDDLGLLTDRANRNDQGAIVAAPAGSLVGYSVARQNEYEWFTDYYLPALQRQGVDINDAEQLSQWNGRVFGSNRNLRLMADTYTMPENRQRIEREAGLRAAAMGTVDTYQHYLRNDPTMARQALAAQWENIQLAFALALTPATVELLVSFATGLGQLSAWISDHPDFIKKFAWVSVIIGIVSTVAGVALVIGGVIAGIAAVFGTVAIGPIVAIAAGIVAAIVAFIAIDWSGLWNWLKNAASGVGQWLGNLGTAIGTAISNAAAAFVRWHLRLIEIVGNFFSNCWTAFRDAGPILFNSLIEWFRNLPSRLAEGIAQGGPIEQPRGQSGFQSRDDWGGDARGMVRGASFVGPPPRGDQPVIVHANLTLDGQVVAQNTSTHWARQLGGPQTGPSDFNPSEGFMPGGFARV